jgi:outer membrane protein insertion porin family
VNAKTSLQVALLLALLPAAALAQVGVKSPNDPEDQLSETIEGRQRDSGGGRLDITDLLVNEGLLVEAVEVEGRRVTREGVVTREIHTKVGEPLAAATIVADVRRLQNMQIFSEVDVEVEPGEGDAVRVTFVLKEMNSWLPTLAVQFTEENGFSAGPGVAALNLTGRNIRLSASAIFGGTTQFWSDFNWPWITGHHIGLRGRGAHLERTDTLNEFEEASNELTLRPSRFLGEHGRLGAGFQLLTVASDRDGKTLSPTNKDLLVSLEASIGWDTRDSWNNPKGGWKNELVVSKTGGALGGDADFWRLIVDLRRWQRTAANQRLMLSGLMSLQSGEVGVGIPEYLQYRLGGANTIRGYDIEKLGRTLFGRDQLLGTAEYSFRVVPMRRFDFWKLSFRLGLELALFGDVGVAWSESRDLNTERTRAGVGTGVRLLIPGNEMVRVDVGWSPEGGFRLHLSGGTKPERQRQRLR